MHRLRLYGLTLVVTILLAHGVHAQEAGTIAALDGAAEVQRAGVWTTALLGTTLQVGDEVRTGDGGRLRIVFRDGSVINLGERSDMIVVEQVFEPDQGLVRSMLHLLHGRLRPLVSNYYQQPAAVYEIDTDSAVIGVRGTEFVVAYDPVAQVSDIVGIAGTVEVHSVRDRVGHAVLVTAQNLTTVTRGAFPSTPQRLSDTLFRQYIDGLEFIGNGRSESQTIGNPLLTGNAVSAEDRADKVIGPQRTAALGVVPLMPGDAPYEVPTVGDVTQQPPLLVRPSGDLGISF